MKSHIIYFFFHIKFRKVILKYFKIFNSYCHKYLKKLNFFLQFDSSSDTTRPGVFVPIGEGRQNCRYIEYMGDPELQPVRSYENAFLVRSFYRLCNYFNTKVRTKGKSKNLIDKNFKN